MGTGQNRSDSLGDISWPKEHVKALGIYFGYNKKEIENLNWNEKVKKIKKTLNIWSSRDLTIFGKVLIIKTLALSQLTHLISSLSIPKQIINEINKEIFAFIWKYKRDKIARKTLINDSKNGGINMIDFNSYCNAIKATWIPRLLNNNDEIWAVIPNKIFSECNLNTLLMMNISEQKHIPIKLPDFYKDVIHAWHLAGGGQSTYPTHHIEIRKQLLWGNKFILSKNKTLYHKHWFKSNINFIDDLLQENGQFKPGEEIFHKLINKRNWMAEYKTIIASIPANWKENIKKLRHGHKN